LAIAAILSLQSDAQDLMAQLPASMRHFRQMLLDAANDNSGWWHRLNVIARSAGATPAMTSSPTALPVPVIKDGLAATVVQGSLGVASLLGQLSIVLFLVYFLLIAPLPVIGAARRPAQEFIGEIAKQVQRYIGVLVVTNILLGLLTWLAFALLGVSHAAVWGLGAAILHFIPYAGAAGTAAGAGLAATVQFESIGTGLLIAAVSLSLSTLVGIALATWLTGRTAKMSTAPLFVGLLFWGWLWGLPGLLLGAPMMMALRAAADRIPTLEWLSRLLRADPHAVATRLPPR
jgi:predicted PurR-regulated permease PerM